MYLDSAPDAVPPSGAASFINRRAERVACDMLVRYAWRGHRATALVKDLTRYGARIEGVNGLRPGDWLTVLLPEVRAIDAEIAWVEGSSAGLAFASAVPAQAFTELVRNFATGGDPLGGGPFGPALRPPLPRAA
ncbi:PilZ domain-containing protein [Novosphingobium piscinae]|uniref:PilZ domain-containing protein n=1 Tax=Novosphingobium piscinae TaxID=1507448 RepID=A0A7X1FXU8_9SPHN|nr:PilZ domain-containing protein [Novosphingobium piscinae]MBC2668928.1 PilZ domain-containing protein [Novosphingobium piscinae]